MPKTVVSQAICDICGAEVREGSLFCYNCGGSVSPESAPVPVPAEPITAVDDKPTNGKAATYDPAKNRSERLEKRRVRAANRQPVEVVWQPRAGNSWAFVVVSLVFFLIAVAVILLAMYVR